MKNWTFKLNTWHFDPLCVIPSVLTPLSEIPNRASDKVRNTFQCNKCNKKFNDKGKVDKHYTLAHEKTTI